MHLAILRDCLGHQHILPIYCPVCEKCAPASFCTNVKRFVNEWYKALSKRGDSPKDRVVKPINIATVLVSKR